MRSTPTTTFWTVRMSDEHEPERQTLWGLFLWCLFGILLGQVTMRLACKHCFPQVFRHAQVWNLVVRLLVAHVVVDMLVRNSCLQDDDSSDHTYNQEDEGGGATTTILLLPLFAIRLIFTCVGVYLGESFRPIALTGGIACGKTTVAQLLVQQPNETSHKQPQQNDDDDDDNKRPSQDKSQEQAPQDDEKENTTTGQHSQTKCDCSFVMVDTDTIAHDILLPPSQSGSDSVYPQIVAKFGTDILVNDDSTTGNQQQPLIDRRKLGAIIFQDGNKRRALNKMTHPRIMSVMLRSLVHESYCRHNHYTVVCADVPLLYESGKLLTWLFHLTIVVACSSQHQFERLQLRNPDLTETQCRERIASQMSIDKKVNAADIVIWNDGSFQQLTAQVNEARTQVEKRMYGVGRGRLSLLTLMLFMAIVVTPTKMMVMAQFQQKTTQET